MSHILSILSSDEIIKINCRKNDHLLSLIRIELGHIKYFVVTEGDSNVIKQITFY